MICHTGVYKTYLFHKNIPPNCSSSDVNGRPYDDEGRRLYPVGP